MEEERGDRGRERVEAPRQSYLVGWGPVGRGVCVGGGTREEGSEPGLGQQGGRGRGVRRIGAEGPVEVKRTG